MSKVYILRGRTEQKAVTDEVTDPLHYTFSEAYTSCDAAMQALRAHLHDLWGYFADVDCFADPSDMNLPHFRGARYGWYFHTFDTQTEKAPLVAEWVMTATEEDDCRLPILPYFVIEAPDIK